MKLTTSKQSLLRILSKCRPVADAKSTMPILANVLLATDGNQLRFSATDLYRSITSALDVEVSSHGSVALNARDLLERVKLMPDGQVSIDTNPETALTTIRAAGSKRKFTLHGFPGDEFPELPEPKDGATALPIPVAVLSQLIESTHFAIGTDESRMHLNSGLLEFEDGSLRMVATDGHRLAMRTARLDGIQKRDPLLIPLKGIVELRKLCEDAGDGHVTLTHSHPNAFFDAADFRFSVKLTDAQFPPYQQVIPEKSNALVQVPRETLLEAVRAVSVAASERTGGVKLTLAKGALRLDSESPDGGEGVDEIAVEYDGSPSVVGFNARYMVDALGAIETDSVSLGLSGELDPITIKPVDLETALYIVMPMRT